MPGLNTTHGIALNIDDDSTLIIVQKQNVARLAATLIHEGGHYLLQQTFGNNKLPYSEDNAESRTAYDQAIASTVKNICSALSGKKDIHPDYTSTFRNRRISFSKAINAVSPIASAIIGISFVLHKPVSLLLGSSVFSSGFVALLQTSRLGIFSAYNASSLLFSGIMYNMFGFSDGASKAAFLGDFIGACLSPGTLSSVFAGICDVLATVCGSRFLISGIAIAGACLIPLAMQQTKVLKLYDHCLNFITRRALTNKHGSAQGEDLYTILDRGYEMYDGSNKEKEGQEFIVRYYETKALLRTPTWQKLLEPMQSYSDRYILPAIQETAARAR